MTPVKALRSELLGGINKGQIAFKKFQKCMD